MELWIRSQDRLRLAKIETVLIDYNKRTEIIGNHKQLDSDNDDCIPLGEYETEERALEVLDEIQKILEPKMLIRFDKNQQKIADFMNSGNKYITAIDNGLVQNINETFVYEMPKE